MACQDYVTNFVRWGENGRSPRKTTDHLELSGEMTSINSIIFAVIIGTENMELFINISLFEWFWRKVANQSKIFGSVMF